jgi:hypothetical protein
MKKAVALFAALFSLSTAYAQGFQAPPPPGQPTGMAPPVGVEAQRSRRPRQVVTLVVVERESLEQRLAQMEALMGDAYDKIKNGHARQRLVEAREELQQVRTALLAAPDVRNYSTPAPPPFTPPPPPVPTVQPIVDGTLKQILRSVSRESFSKDKLRVLAEASQHHYFLVAQVQEVLRNFSFSTDKLQVVEMLWPRVLDRQNSFQLYEAFQSSSDKNKVRDIISR